MRKVLILNGPNLNLLGVREPEIYGTQTFMDYFDGLKDKYQELSLEYYQSNHEGDLIDKLQEVGFSYDAVVFNPGGYTHTSVALTDTVKAITTPVAEVHISNIYEREEFRHHSYIKPNAATSIVGMGLAGYDRAIDYFLHLWSES